MTVGTGVGVIVLRGGTEVLLGRRWTGEWQLPGGHVERGESIVEAARREVREETGLELGRVRVSGVANAVDWGVHYSHWSAVGEWVSGEPRTLEPDKGGDWEWFPEGALPEGLFGPSWLALTMRARGLTMLDSDEVRAL